MEYTIKEYMTSDQLLELHSQGYTSFILPMELYNKTFSAHDADTISLKGETDKRASGSFRFIGIDAPELHQKNSLTGEPIGKIALGKFNEIVSGAQYLKIEVDGVDNKGKRLMGTVYDDKGRDINLLLLKEGYVQFYDRYKESIPHSSLAMYGQAALAAKSNGKLAYSPGVEQPEIWRQKTQGKDVENEVPVPQTPEPSYSKELPTFEDVYGDLYDSEAISQEDKKNSLVYLSRLYEHYYSAVDCTVFLVNKSNGKTVQVDLITGIGYDYNVSSIPVYTVGSRFPAFFTNGNSLGTGTMVLPFKSEKYLKLMLQYLFSEDDSDTTTQKEVVDPATATDYQFIRNQYQPTAVVSDEEIVDIGSILSLVDIKIVFNNSNAFYNDDSDKIIVLRDCKFISENLEALSTRDGTIQHGYKFLFKTTAIGN